MNGLTRETLPDRASWLERRRAFVGGSDVAMILGLSKFGGPMDVWLQKTGKQGEQSNPYQAGGRRFEQSILHWYADELNAPIQLEIPHTLTISRSHSRIAATLDAYRTDVPLYAPIDAKNIRWSTPEWGEPDTDQMPTYYAVQLISQMHVMGGSPFADLAVVFSGQDFTPYRLHRDEELEREIVDRCQRWYEDHVIADVPPEIDGSEGWSKYLAAKIRQTSDRVISATPELHATAVSLHQTKIQIGELEAEKARCENLIKQAIGEAKTCVGANWKAHWSQVKDGLETNWQGIARELAARVADMAAKESSLLLGPSPDLIIAEIEHRHIKVRPGYRRFTFTLKT